MQTCSCDLVSGRADFKIKPSWHYLYYYIKKIIISPFSRLQIIMLFVLDRKKKGLEEFAYVRNSKIKHNKKGSDLRQFDKIKHNKNRRGTI
jgi:hypothetical protein